ncbi:efflux RND transporter periplasmic adaptor subunit [Cupriavidus lacunae]|uniref:Efflux RND transporter periplasmic adaptor subunit n=1 Tax=Cupriavidus lacunae TaxID=2666307 RepID=A0A370NNL9_9BURK|nr:efflux RND transporter periplasmic adaptor subunit [Cupriavidus lacunae]RDK07211.1 efflux RND transporter periplasmic adaptor subunit [Cupriavidus lacunae]
MLQRRFFASTVTHPATSASAFAAVCLLPLALAACGGKPPPDPRVQAPLVRVENVQGASAARRAFTGIVAARVQSDLGFRVPGKVLERLVDTGQSVKRGQPLMRLDPVDLKLAARARQEAVAAAKARATQLAADEERYRDLVTAGAVSASAYDQIKASADSARAQLRAEEAQADVARNASDYAVLPADADGVVVETLAEPGQVVNAGQVVVRLARAGQREAIIQLPETLRPPVGSTARATLYGKDSEAVTATLRQLSDAADRQTRTYEARYVLGGALTDAPLGATVTLQVADPREASQAGLLVPIGALHDPGKGPGVWVLTGTPARVTWRPVTVRGISDDSARVEGPIRPGDRVVALGAHLLNEGQQVRVVSEVKVAEAATDGKGHNTVNGVRGQQ